MLSSEELLFFTAQGVRKAFDTFFLRHQPGMYAFFLRMTNNRALAEDQTQELFLKVYLASRFFDKQKNAVSWLYSLAWNQCKNHWRHQKVHQQFSRYEIAKQDFEEERLSEQIDRSLVEQILEQSVRKLDQEQILLITLRFQEEMSIKEIAVVLDCKEGTVKSRLFYTLKRLNEYMKVVDYK